MTEAKEEVQTIKLVEVVPLPYNVSGRLDSELDQMLRTDMGRAEKGLYKIDPILVRRLTEEEIQKYKEKNPWAKFMLVDGYKRWEAARELGWHNIRAIITDMTLDEALEFNYKKNKIRGTVDPLRESAYFTELSKKMTVDKIAEKFGMSPRRVLQILSRLRIYDETRQTIKKLHSETGFTMLAPHYEVLGTVEKPEIQKQLATVIAKEELSRREAEVAKEAIEKGLPPEKTVKLLKKAKHEKLTPKEAKVVVEAIAKKPEVETLLELPKPKLVEEAKKITTPPPKPEEIAYEKAMEAKQCYPATMVGYIYERYKGEHFQDVLKAATWLLWSKLTEEEREKNTAEAIKLGSRGFKEPISG